MHESLKVMNSSMQTACTDRYTLFMLISSIDFSCPIVALRYSAAPLPGALMPPLRPE